MDMMNSYLFLLGIGFVASVFVVIAIYTLSRDLHVRREFLETRGTITKSEVLEGRTAKRGSTFTPYIAFAYEVSGRTYSTGQYWIHTIASSGREAKEAICARFPVGSVQQAWYDPNKPEIAVLVKDFSRFPFVVLVSLIMAGIAAVVLLWL